MMNNTTTKMEIDSQVSSYWLTQFNLFVETWLNRGGQGEHVPWETHFGDRIRRMCIQPLMAHTNSVTSISIRQVEEAFMTTPNPYMFEPCLNDTRGVPQTCHVCQISRRCTLQMTHRHTRESWVVGRECASKIKVLQNVWFLLWQIRDAARAASHTWQPENWLAKLEHVIYFRRQNATVLDLYDSHES